jgi:hypothetical protein
MGLITIDRGCRIWQLGQSAQRACNALTHYELCEMPALKGIAVWTHFEAILLLLIGPSTLIGKSVMSKQHEPYAALYRIRSFVTDFEERPIHKGRSISPGSVIFSCPFNGVDVLAPSNILTDHILRSRVNNIVRPVKCGLLPAIRHVVWNRIQRRTERASE